MQTRIAVFSSVVLSFSVALLLVGYGSSDSTSCETEALEKWRKNSDDRVASIQSGSISASIQNGWWTLAAEMLKFAQDEGLDVITETRNSLAAAQRELAELSKLLEQSNDQMQTFSPAIQWAESKDKIFIRIKLAYRWSSPGALVLENQNVTLLADRVLFSGVGTHSNIAKLYKLDITLHDEIVPEESDYSWGAVGQMLMTLKKVKADKWETLLKDTEKKLANLQIWWEMKEKIEEEERKFTEELADFVMAKLNKTKEANKTRKGKAKKKASAAMELEPLDKKNEEL